MLCFVLIIILLDRYFYISFVRLKLHYLYLSCSCGSCGFDLNLSSSSRNTSAIGSKYGKSIKKGIISFVHVDESRFTQSENFQCVPYFFSKQSWGLFRRRTKLMCRKCGNYIGVSYDDNASTYPIVAAGINSLAGSEISVYKKYDIRIRALQPFSSAASSSITFV